MSIKYTFKQWCEDNNRQDILIRWDYEKTGFRPDDISYGSEKSVWLYCPKDLHESEPHKIDQFHKGRGEKGLECRKCNSFAQYVINKYNENYLNKIWSNENDVSPWDIDHGSHKKVLLNLERYNEPHAIAPQKFLREKQERYIPDDSNVKQGKALGDYFPQVLSVWSDKNKTTPFDYYASSDAEVWWKCENEIHEDYKRRIDSSKARGFTCPVCGRLGKGLIDLTWNKYGKLTVIEFDKSVDGIPYWLCECGNIVSMRGVVLREGKAKSCGAGFHYTGENNPNWKSGEKTENQRIRSCKPYQHWRNAIIDKYGIISPITLCSINNPELHHIYPMSLYPELMFEEWNTMILDKEFHSMHIPSGFHYQYGSKNNTPEQLEEFINKYRKEYGIDEPFYIEKYISDMKEQAKVNPVPKPIIKFKED